MAEDISKILGWAYIGTPAGMQSKRGGCISDFEIGPITDLDNRYIEIYPNTEILCQHWELRNNLPVTYYILYRFAREINAGRHGAFYGSVLVSVRYELEPALVYSILTNLAESLAHSLDDNQRFKTNITSLELPEPPQLRQLSQSLTKVSIISLAAADNSCFLKLNRPDLPKEQAAIKAGADFFRYGSKLQASKIYNRVYGSANPEIIKYVQERKSLKVLDFNTLIYELSIEKKNDEIFDLSEKLDQTKLTLVSYEVQFNDFKAQAERLELETRKTILNLENQLFEAQKAMPAGIDQKDLADRLIFPHDAVSQRNDRQISKTQKSQVSTKTQQKAGQKAHQGQVAQQQSDRKKSEKNKEALKEKKTSASKEVKNITNQLLVFWLHYRVYIFAGLVLLSLSCFLAYNEYPDLFKLGSTNANVGISSSVMRAVGTANIQIPLLPVISRAPLSNISQKPIEVKAIPVSNPKTFAVGSTKQLIDQGTAPIKTSDVRVSNIKADPASLTQSDQGIKKGSVVVRDKLPEVKWLLYTVVKGDYSLKIILKHINKHHPEVSMLNRTETSDGLKNAIIKDHNFKVGEKLYYTVTVRH